MKHTFYCFLTGIIVLTLFSCVSKDSYDKMSAQNDSLKNAKQMIERELDDYFSTMNEISDNFDKIKGTEQIISVDAGGELRGDKKTKVINDLSYISDLISTNKQKIADLEEKLKSSNVNSNQLRASVTRLTNELTAAKERLSALEVELKQKDGTIITLTTHVDSLNRRVSSLDENVTALQAKDIKNEEVISNQDYALNSGYYAIGTSKELKAQKIMTSGGFFSSAKILQNGFNKEYFTRVDIRQSTKILLNADKVKIMTNHPASSYKLEVANPEDRTNKNLVLKISNPVEFWSLSKFLVVEVK
jgi:chromosome segregation ATPase